MRLSLSGANGFGFIIAMLALVLSSCTSSEEKSSGTNDGKGSADSSSYLTGRVAMLGFQRHDSAASANSSIVDKMLAQAFDSIDGVEYIGLDKVAQGGEADSAQAIADIVRRLDLDHYLTVRIARFGSVTGVDMALFDAAKNRQIYRDRAFSFIRYRDADGNKLFGPALYEALRRNIDRFVAGGDADTAYMEAEPLIVANVIIERDTALGRLVTNRVAISKDGVRAIGDYARWKSPNLVVFDYESRSRLYETVGLGLVEDHSPVGSLEKEAMFNLDIPYYLTNRIVPIGTDSIEIQAEIHRVTGRTSDEIVDRQSARYPLSIFSGSTIVKDVIAEILVIDEPLIGRLNEMVRQSEGMRSNRSDNGK